MRIFVQVKIYQPEKLFNIHSCKFKSKLLTHKIIKKNVRLHEMLTEFQTHT